MFGAAWTWSKTMDLVDGNNVINPFIDPRIWHYGKAGLRPDAHVGDQLRLPDSRS